MSPNLGRVCPFCKEYLEIPIVLGQKNETEKVAIVSPLVFDCPACQKEWGRVKNQNDLFDYCPVCDCRQFYLSKDFNQLTGCIIMGVGIVLVPWTYGLSLPFFALIDWLLYRRVATIVSCYRCGSEFKGIPIGTSPRFKSFMHHIGLKYDKYR